jgi:hypothetical protein
MFYLWLTWGKLCTTVWGMARHRKQSHITEEAPLTASIDDVSSATKNATRGEWLDWAMAFAQANLDRLMPGRRHDLRRQLKQFLMAQGPGVSGSPEVPLPSEAQLRTAQRAFAEMIESILVGKAVHLGYYALEVRVSVRDGIPSLIEFLDIGALPDEGQAQYAFARLLSRVGRDFCDAGYEGPLIKACRAPKPRRKEPCGKWFVGRPNQRFCSPHCQNRAGSRASRARHKSVPAS